MNMNNYVFSKHSYDKLKSFIQLVETNITDNASDKLKSIFPVDTELLHTLKNYEYTDSQSHVIEIKDTPEDNLQNMEITDILDDSNIGNQDDAKQNLPDSNVSTSTNHQEIIKNLLFSIKEMLDLSITNDIITVLSKNDKYLDFIFEELKDHKHILQLSTFVANCNNLVIVETYCNIILHKHILCGTEGISLIVEDFLEKHPHIMCVSLVKSFLVVSNDDNITNEFSNTLTLISETNKINILRMFLAQSVQLNISQLKIVNFLLHNNMDLLNTKNLLDLVTKNAVNLIPDRIFALFLENLISKINKNLLPLKEQIKNVVSLVPGILKLKLFKMLNTLEQKGSENSYSDTMQF